MAKKKDLTLTESFRRWTAGEDWNSRLNYLGWDYAHMVSMCEAVAAGDQWKEMQAIPGFDPTFNIIKPSKMYNIATILSSRVTGTFFAEGMDETEQDEKTAAIMKAIEGLNKHMILKWDRMNMDYMARELLNSCADAGDVYTHTYWEPKKDTGQPKVATEKEMGDYCTELVDGVNVMFGNPNQKDPQKQPYILVGGREMVSILREEAKANRASAETINAITSDENWENQAGDMGKIELQDDGDGKCQYIYTYELIKGKIYCTKETRGATIYAKKDTKLKLYPIALLNWETRKNSHRGNPFTLYAIKNQRFVNKMMAMLMAWMIKMSLGKYIIDEDMITGFSNEIGEVVKVHGSPSQAVMQIQPGNINSVVLQVIDLAIKLTKDSLGANDAAMGNISNPDNTSAIIANSQLSAIPLENIKANYMLFLEQQYLIWADFMVGFYTNGRKLTYKDKDGKVRTESFDADTLREALLNVKIEIGPSSYYSEIAAQTTLDNLLAAERISFIQYLQRIKPGLIPKSDELIEELKAQQLAEQPITLEELTADMSPEEIDALMNDPQKMEQLKAEGVV